MENTVLSKVVIPIKIFVLIILFSFFFTNISCSKDTPDDIEVFDDAESPNDPEDDQNSEDTGTSGTIMFDENFILDEDRKLISFILSDAEYNKFLEGDGDMKMVSQQVYEYFNDDFDFIFILSVEESQPDGLYYGKSYKVKNDIQGLGMSIYNGAAAYGSQGTLKSIIHMPRTEYIVTGPFLHEIAHYWGNHGFIPTTVGGHWGYSGTGGQLGGFDELINLGNNTYQGKLNGSNSFGTFANGGNSVPYSNLELYTMGLINANELEPIQVAENPQPTQEAGKFTADSITIKTGEALIAEHGDRVPSEQNSQKAFKAITVVISTSLLSQEKIDTVNRDIENFSRKGALDSYWGNAYNFWGATGEKASIEVQVSNNNIK